MMDNLKFSSWIQSLGIGKGESISVGMHNGTISVGDKDSGIDASSVNKGEIYLHFIDSKPLVSEDGMVNSLAIEQDKAFDVNYSILVTKEIYLMSISNVYYNGELVPEDGNGSYKVSDNGILAKEPVTSYKNLDFRGWYVQNANVVGIYGSRVKFPLMISDLPVSNGSDPKLSAAFTVLGFTSVIKVKVDYSIHGFVWNGMEFAAPGYAWCNLSGDVNSCTGLSIDSYVPAIKDEDGNEIKKLALKDSSKALSKGYWIASISSDGNNDLTHT
jgi:hypothetical protein